ncbi:MAG TPA: YjfB family protein [Sulfuriferula sp.]|nr:YjfB family protein [Sulfuriferula sp.]
MDASSIASLATSLTDSRANQAVGIAVLKKVLDVESGTAAALIGAIPAALSSNLPPHLGQNVNTTA